MVILKKILLNIIIIFAGIVCVITTLLFLLFITIDTYINSIEMSKYSDDKLMLSAISPNNEYIAESYAGIWEGSDIIIRQNNIKNDYITEWAYHVYVTDIVWSEDSNIVAFWDIEHPVFSFDLQTKKSFAIMISYQNHNY